MERLPPLTALAALALAAASVGCHSTRQASERVSEKVTHAVHAATTPWEPPPASQIICVAHPRLSSLPDPTRDGTPAPGLVCQVFLVAPNGAAAEVAGDVTFAVYDESARPPGTPAKTPEVWHFDKATLKKLVASDERFGRFHAVFIPWRADWADVTAVRIMTRYDVPGQPPLHANPVQATLDSQTGPVWQDAGGAGTPPPAAFDPRGVPNGGKLAQQQQAKSPPLPVVPAGAAVPARVPPPAGIVTPIIVPATVEP